MPSRKSLALSDRGGERGVDSMVVEHPLVSLSLSRSLHVYLLLLCVSRCLSIFMRVVFTDGRLSLPLGIFFHTKRHRSWYFI